MVILKPPEESWLESVLSLEPAERDGTNLAQSVLTLLINFFYLSLLLSDFYFLSLKNLLETDIVSVF